MTKHTPTQADRDAAAAQAEWLRIATLEWQNIEPFFVSDFADAVRKGIWDEHPFVQAFAAHRIQSQKELLEALEALLAVAQMTTFSDQYPAECERADTAIARTRGGQE